MWKWIKDNIRNIVMILIFISCLALIVGVILMFSCACRITKEKIVTGIIIPMVCALIGASITIAMDNSLSNEKLKISLNRLEWWWKYHCIDKYGNFKSGYESLDFDVEYKFILENRGKSHEKIFRSMTDNYWNTKYSLSNTKLNKEKFLMDWIKDHFIY